MEYRILNEKPGIATHGNPLILPKGSAKNIENWKCVRDNVYTKVRGRKAYGSNLPAYNVRQFIDYKNRLFVNMSNDTLYYDSDGSGTFAQVTGTFEEPESGYKIDSIQSGGNLYLTTSGG